MPASAIIGAGVSVAQGVSGKKGAKKAAKIQAQTAAENRALFERIYNQNAAMYQPEQESGNRAATKIDELLGLVPAANGATPTDVLRQTPGYQFRVDEALKGVNTNAYATGLGNSGAALKALQTRAMGLADNTFDGYISQLTNVANRGTSAKDAITGAGNTMASNVAGVNQNNANAQSGYQMQKASIFNDMIGSLGQLGAQTLGSSYGGGRLQAPTPQQTSNTLNNLPINSWTNGALRGIYG